jgi:S-adenosylmethionine:tRNA ribosyltransferase-isomerase
MLLSNFNYELPPERIAQRPLDQRDASRMLILNRQTQAWEDSVFRSFPALLRGGELIVVNNARVIPARLFGRRAGVRAEKPGRNRRTVREFLSSEIEVLLTRQVTPEEWEALVRPGRKMRVGERVEFGEGELTAEVVGRGEYGLRRIRLTAKGDVNQAIERLGHIPLPPYISREDEPADRERYQTIFADHPGAVAAPTAGLHFSPAILNKLKERGVEIATITLQVGLGTFQPIHVEEIEQHQIHSERYEISEQAAAAICKARRDARPILAIGTTVVRALEDAAAKAALKHAGKPAEEVASAVIPNDVGNLSEFKTEEKRDSLARGAPWNDSLFGFSADYRSGGGARPLIEPGQAQADIFIKPGHQFRAVDQLLTNFHLPQSSLLILVSAFAGRELTLRAYRHAVEAGYRFYSYGDCMWIR